MQIKELNRVFPANSNFLIFISLQSNVVDPPLNENAPFLFIESMYNVCVKNLIIVLLLRVQMRNIEMKREAEKLNCKDEKTKEKYRKKYIDINNNNNNIKLPN